MSGPHFHYLQKEPHKFWLNCMEANRTWGPKPILTPTSSPIAFSDTILNPISMVKYHTSPIKKKLQNAPGHPVGRNGPQMSNSFNPCLGEASPTCEENCDHQYIYFLYLGSLINVFIHNYYYKSSFKSIELLSISNVLNDLFP